MVFLKEKAQYAPKSHLRKTTRRQPRQRRSFYRPTLSSGSPPIVPSAMRFPFRIYSSYPAMADVFISYRRVDPDQKLAAELSRYCAEHHVSYFLDTEMRIRQESVKVIDRELRDC